MFVLFSVLGIIKYLQISAAIAKHSNFQQPPETVTSALVIREEWPVEIKSVGSIRALQGVTLSAEQSGTVTKISFEPGAVVESGQVLFELDTTLERAELKAAEAEQLLAKRSYDRVQALKGSGAVSKEQLDQVSMELARADAKSESLRAIIAKKQIMAPFKGSTGIRLVNLGQYVAQGEKLVELHDLSQLSVRFSLPQQKVADVKLAQRVRIIVDPLTKQEVDGYISAINPSLDPVLRQLELEATILSPSEKLRAGMFVSVVLVVEANSSVLSVPLTAVSFAPYGDSLYLIENESAASDQSKRVEGQVGSETAKLVVRQQTVQLGDRRGDRIAVLSGVKEGEQVVTSGIFKLRPGAGVQVNNTLAPEALLNPKPKDS